MPAEVTLYTRANCPLCEKAKTAIAQSGAAVRLTAIDVDTDPLLRERYTSDVPVIHVDGQEAFRHRVDPEAFAGCIRAVEHGWTIVEGRLEKTWTFADFAEALAFTNRVGAEAERQNHHPDVHLAWGKVRLQLWSHDAGRLTARDFRLAASIDAL